MSILDRERIHPETLAEWRTWLAANHKGSQGCWLVSWKRETGKPILGYEEAVIEALCWGWIDSHKRSIDAERSMLMFTPRKKGSGWSATNKVRLANLEPGRMQPAGQAVIDAAKADGSWERLDSVEALEAPEDLKTALASYPKATTHWEGFPAGTRKMILAWIASAKTAETRRKRIAITAEMADRNERAQ